MATYWIMAVISVATILTSLDYSFSYSMLLGVMFLPGCLAARFLIPKVRSDKPHLTVLYIICVVTAILLVDILLIIWSHLLKGKTIFYTSVVVEPMVLNPVFLCLIMTVVAYGDYLLSEYLKKNNNNLPQSITFTSDYKKVTLDLSEIMYIESRDREVWVYASDNRTFRNKTPISQWQNILETGFVRIHRAYLINRSYIMSYDNDTVRINSTDLPISRKNRDEVLNDLASIPSSAPLPGWYS